MGLKARHGEGILPLEEVQRIIAAYEEKYNVSTEEFLRQWKAGTAPDNEETNDWNILIRTNYIT